MIRRYGEPVKGGQIYRRRPGVYAILLRGDDILLTHQAEPDDEFQLPGAALIRANTRCPRCTAR